MTLRLYVGVYHEASQYSWLFGWFGNEALRNADVKINVICPATDVHIRKVRASHTGANFCF